MSLMELKISILKIIGKLLMIQVRQIEDILIYQTEWLIVSIMVEFLLILLMLLKVLVSLWGIMRVRLRLISVEQAILPIIIVLQEPYLHRLLLNEES